MNAPPQAGYRQAPWALHAEWIVEEADLHAATKALPGSTLALVRWPVAFFIAYVGVALADPRVGAAFAFGSAAVISGAWIILSLGRRGTDLRKVARLPQPERATRLSIHGDRIRHETASGHAAEYPLSDLLRAKLVPAGLLLDVRGQVFFVPMRALGGSEDAWRAFSGLPARAWPRRIGFTVGLWLFAVAVAAYAFVK